ncbi:MAG: ribonuclease R [Bacteroidetes bacterium]|nr:ribonuclease R [Bacteroidota bacterium]
MPRKNQQSPNPFTEPVLDVLKHNAGKILNYKQISALLELHSESDRVDIIESLDLLVKEGLILERELGKFQYKEQELFENGTIDFISSGGAYVITSPTEKDIFIPKGKTKDALHGDTVQVKVTYANNHKREGIIQKVIQRRRTDFVGVAQVTAKSCFVVPDNNKLHVDFFIPLSKTKEVKDGQKVLIKLVGWQSGENCPMAEISEILGYPGAHTTEMHAIMAEYNLPDHFPEEVEAAAKGINTQITNEEIALRKDFRNTTTFTIDPYDAKDFDDALSFKKLPNGHYEVGVHIADVTHYVKPHDIIDEEGVQRATSVYLVDRVIPMLPEILSNFVCSLRPKEEKLCFSAVFEMNEQAQIVNEWFGKTVIFSDRRFTYEEVQEIIEGKPGDFKEEILILDALAKKLRDERTKNGSIFFDKEEVKFRLDEKGVPVEVFFKVQKDAHKLIEDFMLLANKKVATALTQALPKNSKPTAKSAAAVYRIHDSPANEKLTDLNSFVAKFGYSLNMQGKKSTTASINKLLRDVKGKPEAGTIEILAIRSMPKAVYSTENIGHYGLGFDYYTHFTSPIRRYPDMMVHRLLEAYIKHQQYSNLEELENLCKHASAQEKTAAEAERASIKYKQVEFLKDKVGHIFPAIISGVTEWGIYAEIIENKCEGLIRVREMKDDYYTYDEDNYCYIGKRSKKVFALGDKVLIEVKNADMLKKQLDFLLVDTITPNETQHHRIENRERALGNKKDKKGHHEKNKSRKAPIPPNKKRRR